MSNRTSSEKTVREPIVDGIFYPAEQSALRQRIKELLDKSGVEPGQAAAIISPHASFDFSGDIAASVFQKTAGRDIETVVILGPVHREQRDEIYLTESDVFNTPLGEIRVDKELIDELSGFSNKVFTNDIPHLEEHCIEIQLPFIQYLFPQASIVPILIGEPNLSNVELIARSLRYTFSSRLHKTLFVVSSNMSCYKHKEEAKQGFDRLMQLIEAGDWKNIIAEAPSICACGSACIAAILALFKKNVHIDTMRTGDSSSFKYESDNVIYYAGISIEREEPA